MSAEADITTYLQAQGVGTLGTNVFQGPIRPVSNHIPANSIFVRGSGGASAQRYLSGGARIENRHPNVQVTIRNTDHILGLAKAEEVHDALQAARISGYWDCKVEQSAPLSLGEDENNNNLWTVNCTLSKRETGW